MIEGHGDDSYKYNRPITANFSSNVYSKVDLSLLKAHLCERIGGIGNYPEPEPYTLEARIARQYHLPADAVCVTNGATEAIYLIRLFCNLLSASMRMPAVCTDIGLLHYISYPRHKTGISYRTMCGCFGCAIPIIRQEQWLIRNICAN